MKLQAISHLSVEFFLADGVNICACTYGLS